MTLTHKIEADELLAKDIAVIQSVLMVFDHVQLALVFGSVAKGTARPDSDLDIAIEAQEPLLATQRMALIEALASATGRPVDLIDLKTVTQPLLNQIMQSGVRVVGSSDRHADWATRNVFDQADFVPYQQRLLAERRKAWIGN
jgi:predicted nucleotidyltransferase